VQHAVLADYRGIRIRQKLERISPGLAELPGLFRRIDADCGDLNSTPRELIQVLLETP
jgi:hypothetical protein